MSATTSCAPSFAFGSSGSTVRFFVAVVDADRQPIRILSGACHSLPEALRCLIRARRLHARAVIMRELLLREVVLA